MTLLTMWTAASSSISGRGTEPALKALKAFSNNNYFGIAIFFGIALEFLFQK
jgi:hypothetical protein